MSLETFIKPIQTENIEQHEAQVERVMLGLQLEYINGILKHTIPTLSNDKHDYDFKDRLIEQTDILSILRKKYKQRKGLYEFKDDQDDAYKIFRQKVIADVTSIYNSGDILWTEKVGSIIDNYVESLSTSEPKEDKPINEKHYSGVINFEISNGDNTSESIGFPKGAHVMHIHLEPLYKQKSLQDKDIKNIFSSQTMQNLAVDIVEKYQNVEVIKARSWLMDTSIAKRMGFHIDQREENQIMNTTAFWGQFVNDNGQINKERVSQFFTTGIPPYFVASGHIPTVEFLKKYLPIEKRGRIILKEVDPIFDSNCEKDFEIFNGTLAEWESISKEKLNNCLNKTIVLKEFVEKKASNFLQDIIDCYDRGLTLEELTKDPIMLGYKYLFDEFKEEKKYIKKEYDI